MLFLDYSRNFLCVTCQKSYTLKSTLSRHMKYECGKAPRFGCSYCEYKGFHKSNVLRHIKKIHSSTKLENDYILFY